ncbi:MAG TPA: SRPBCC family protein [Jatrophihabitantaceae bacterium]|jgi:uncharacterized protein YndB with AHSA1/START domain
MWTVDHHGESTAQPATVYALLADTARWAEWNDGVRSIELDGPFAAGTTATMVLPDGTSLPFRLAWVDPARGFEDVTEVPDAGVVVRVAHLLEPRTGGGTRITYRCTVEGPDEVGAEVGPAVSGDFPDVIAALSKRAARTEAIEAAAQAESVG